MNKLRLMICTLLLVVGLAAQPALAQWVVFDPTNWMQNYVTALNSVTSNINQARQIAQQLQQYQNMLQNTKSLTSGQWTDASGKIAQLANIVQQGHSLAYSMKNLDQAFKAKFPGYHPTGNYPAKIDEWSQTSLDSIRGALLAAHAQASDMQGEAGAIRAMSAAAANSQGQKAAIDASNQIALEQVAQLQQLRTLTSAQMQAQSAYMASHVQEQATSAANVKAFIGTSKPPTKRPGFTGSGLDSNQQ